MAWFVVLTRLTHRVQTCVSSCTLLVGCQYGALATVAYCAHAFLLLAGVLVRHRGTIVKALNLRATPSLVTLAIINLHIYLS